MSNYLSVAAVTETIAHVVRDAVRVVPGAQVTTDRPERAGKDALPRVNVFLYQVTPDAALRNADVPTRGPDGSLVKRPRAAIDLHYLISFYGKDEQLVSQQLLALTTAALHAHPVLTRDLVIHAIHAAPSGFLDGSDLPDQAQPVRLTPAVLNLEELSRLWQIMFQIPYNLTVSYRASVVLLDADVQAPSPLPTRSVSVTSVPSRRPVVSAVLPVDDAPGEPVFGSKLLVRGTGLANEGARVMVEDIALTPVGAVSDEQLEVALTDDGLRAGRRALRVVGDDGIASDPVPFTLHPRIDKLSLRRDRGSAPLRSGAVTVTLAPPVVEPQDVRLLLDEYDPPADRGARRYGFAAPWPSPPRPVPTPVSSVNVPVTGLQPGRYLARIVVDGVESPLGVDGRAGRPTTGRYNKPLLKVP